MRMCKKVYTFSGKVFHIVYSRQIQTARNHRGFQHIQFFHIIYLCQIQTALMRHESIAWGQNGGLCQRERVAPPERIYIENIEEGFSYRTGKKLKKFEKKVDK